MTFNDKIDIFMKENGYKNIKQLAKACDIPYTTLRDFYEKKSADNSRLATIRKLSKFMNCPLDYLAYDEVENFNNINFYNNTNINIDTDNNVNIDKEINSKMINNYDFAKILYKKVKDLPENKQKMVLNLTEAIMKDIDDQLDNK